MSSSTESSSSQTLSPFLSPSVSELTADDHPDLGQFNFVFHTLTNLHRHPWIPAFTRVFPDDPPATPDGSTVWHQLPILSYLDSHTPSELILGPAWAPPQPTESPGQSDDDDDTEGALTVDIASNDGDELDVSIGDGSPDSHSEISSTDGGAIPPMWESPGMRIALCAYSPAWDSEDNPDEFGPFDGATTASSGTRPTSGSLDRDAAGTPSSLPSFPAHDDNSSPFSDTYELLERPASLPAEYRFSSPCNDNSTRSSYSVSASPPQSIVSDISHQHGHAVQPQSFVPHDHHYQHRRYSGSGSASTVTSASSTTTATHAVHEPTPDLEGAVLDDSSMDEEIPSLGLLDEALKFIAEERARWEALRDAGNLSGGMSSDSERWKNELGESLFAAFIHMPIYSSRRLRLTDAFIQEATLLKVPRIFCSFPPLPRSRLERRRKVQKRRSLVQYRGL